MAAESKSLKKTAKHTLSNPVNLPDDILSRISGYSNPNLSRRSLSRKFSYDPIQNLNTFFEREYPVMKNHVINLTENLLARSLQIARTPNDSYKNMFAYYYKQTNVMRYALEEIEKQEVLFKSESRSLGQIYVRLIEMLKIIMFIRPTLSSMSHPRKEGTAYKALDKLMPKILSRLQKILSMNWPLSRTRSHARGNSGLGSNVFGNSNSNSNASQTMKKTRGVRQSMPKNYRKNTPIKTENIDEIFEGMPQRRNLE
jgi:hypothetical protein